MKYKYKPQHCLQTYSKAASILLISTGILIILAVSGMKLYAKQQQKALIEAYVPVASSVTDKDKTISTDPKADIMQLTKGIEVLQLKNTDKQIVSTPICLLEIPKIDLTVAVVEGIDNLSLRYAVGHSTGTAMPGQNGNFSVFGHRNYVFGEFFNRLDEIEKGDSILVMKDNKNYTYIVTDVFIVEPQETWVLDPTPNAQITLVTCTPVRIATHRLIVKGVLKTF